MNVWGRSWFYRLYVVGGIGGIVAYTVVTGTAATPGDDTPLKRAVSLVAIWFVGLLALQGAALLADRETLSNRAWSFAQRGFALIVVLGISTALGGVLYVNGVDAAIGPLWNGGPSLPVVFLPTVVITIGWGLRTRAMVREAVEIGNEHLQSLGLEIRSMPQSTVLPTASGGLRHQLRGNTVLGGVRDGREVTVELSAGGSVIHLSGATEPFERVSEDGRARMTGGPDGVRVERRGGAGTDAWERDLAAAEQLASASARRSASGP